MYSKEEKKQRQVEATNRWRKKNPEKVEKNQIKQNEKRKEERRNGITRYNSKVRCDWNKKKMKDPVWKEKLRKQENERIRKVKLFIADYKMERGCTDCGYRKHHTALEFDHIRGKKELNVCLSKSIAQAKKEIEKCEVVCSNCHRIRTYNRLHHNMNYEEVLYENH
tara:strand:+ start:313 stop:810 length:498 start_codon:yes stop_codon:yes gene_type:complete